MRAYLLSILFLLLACSEPNPVTEKDPDPIFRGESSDLKNTEIVGVLDTEVKPGKNLIWCSTLISAWKEIEKKITKEPPLFLEENSLVSSLNAAVDPSTYVPEKASYSNAGVIKDGILDEIKKDLNEKFPGKSMPNFVGLNPSDIISYAYLKAGIKFSEPYNENDEPFIFTDSNGKKSKVNSFGIFGRDTYNSSMASQIKVLYGKVKNGVKQFIVDLDRNSSHYQILIASIEPQTSLENAVKFINDRLEATGLQRYFSRGDTLIVPQTVWKIIHHYEELLKQNFKNKNLEGYYISRAQQDIEFKLHSKGAEVESEVEILMEKSAVPKLEFDGKYEFDKPFYIIMRKRGEEQPFFVMYVDNAELLHPWK